MEVDRYNMSWHSLISSTKILKKFPFSLLCGRLRSQKYLLESQETLASFGASSRRNELPKICTFLKLLVGDKATQSIVPNEPTGETRDRVGEGRGSLRPTAQERPPSGMVSAQWCPQLHRKGRAYHAWHPKRTPGRIGARCRWVSCIECAAHNAGRVLEGKTVNKLRVESLLCTASGSSSTFSIQK